MVVPMGADMEAPGAQLPPPPELLRFKPLLVVVFTGYLAVFVARLLANDLGNDVVNGLFALVASALMAFNSQQCLGQCLLPFALFAFMALFFDIVSLVQILMAQRTLTHPGVGDLFSLACPYELRATLGMNTTVYTIPDHTAYLVKGDTPVEFPSDLCSWQWVLGNVAVILSVVVDIGASALGWRMFKVARTMPPGADGAGPFGGGALLGGGGMPPGGDAPPGGALPPGGGPRGGGPNGRYQAPGRQAPGQQGGFQPFQGGGQTLGS